MRTILFCVFGTLLIATCWSQTDALLQQAIRNLNLLIPQEMDSGILLHSPTNDIKECCSHSALKCFRKQLNSATHKNKLKTKLARNLGKSSIMNSVNTCSAEQIEKAECMSCESYRLVSSKAFLMNLQSLLQKAYSRLS